MDFFTVPTVTGRILFVFVVLLHHRRRIVHCNDTEHPTAPWTTQQVVEAFPDDTALVGLGMATYLVSLHGSTDLQSTLSEERPVTPGTHNGIIDKPSNHPVDQTVESLKTILQAKGAILFAVVDHSGEAAKVGMSMRPTKLLIFGSPKAGTPLMLAAPSTAIDLPLKILVWQDAGGKVWMSYNSPAYLKERHGLPPELLANISVVETLAAQAAE
jgi:uncharacterized protein (DUF302 family)